MNTTTGETRMMSALSYADLLSGEWVPLPKKYVPKIFRVKGYRAKTAVSDADRRRVLKAEAKRLRRQATRLALLAASE